MLHRNLTISFLLLISVVFSITTVWADDDYDDDDYRERRVYAQKKVNYISAQKAGQIARSRVKNSRVRKIDFDHDDRYGAVYEVDLVSGRAEYDIKINAKTGKVIYVRRDY